MNLSSEIGRFGLIVGVAGGRAVGRRPGEGGAEGLGGATDPGVAIVTPHCQPFELDVTIFTTRYTP